MRAHDAAKEHGFKLIVGTEFARSTICRLVLLAPTQAGYTEICALITRGAPRAPTRANTG